MIRIYTLLVLLGFVIGCSSPQTSDVTNTLKAGFANPPDSSRPGVYWYFMDGNMSRTAITGDLEAMKKAGIGYVVFLEVNMGVPRGKVDFLSDEWQNLFAHAISESKRLGISVTLGVGPGWTGSGGPWVRAEASMQHMVATTTAVRGGRHLRIKLKLPPPVKPYFGESSFTPELHEQWKDYSKDIAVLAFPSMMKAARIKDIMEKGLYYRAPFSSVKDVAPYIEADSSQDSAGEFIQQNRIIDLTDSLSKDGILSWTPPPGNWTIMRFVARNNGAVTRPAPIPGVGFEADKFDTTALNDHMDAYVGKLLTKIGPALPGDSGGLKMLHMDSWEMGAQNWTAGFRETFIKHRGYDPLPYYPVYAGFVVGNKDISERFLWDLRLTAQELVVENHANQVKRYAHRAGLGLSIEPYDMNPASDIELGDVADVPMCEFWSRGMGFNTTFSSIEASSIAHVNGINLVPAEAFTTCEREGWTQYPGVMKNQTDWAFASGINRLVFHTFQHQNLDGKLKPGMTMGPCGIQWNRNQTFWPMVDAYHKYVSRCQYLLQQGHSNAEILFLTPEGGPMVFQPPSSAFTGDSVMPNRKSYNFDGCSPGQLMRAAVKDNQIIFPSGARYQVLVLPQINSMSAALLNKIKALVNEGAVVVGTPPVISNGLAGYPRADEDIKNTSRDMWGALTPPQGQTERTYGKGKILWGGAFNAGREQIYPDYDEVMKYLSVHHVVPQFVADPRIRYTHRTLGEKEVYFVSNITSDPIQLAPKFGTTGMPELWDPVTGSTRALNNSQTTDTQTEIALTFRPHESYFIVFDTKNESRSKQPANNFPADSTIMTLTGSWDLSFDTSLGGPARVRFDTLTDWRQNTDAGIRYYSGIAKYSKHFDLSVSQNKDGRIWLDLGKLNIMASVKLNGQPLGVVWTDPRRVDITGAVKAKDNLLEIEVANLWINRMIGDDALPDDGITNGKWPSWLEQGQPRPGKRISFLTNPVYHTKDTLMPSGLLGPVTIQTER